MIGAVIGTVGDVLEDIVVELAGPINAASDTTARITRRLGGSAANVAVAAAQAAGTARFIGQVGDDRVGHGLVEDLRSRHVDPLVRHEGRSGSIVVLVDADGERTMLSDRGAATGLDRPQHEWLRGLDALHVPLYSLVAEPLASTASSLISWSSASGRPVSIDLSSTSVIEDYGPSAVVDLVAQLAPTVVFANRDEAALLRHHLLEPEALGSDLFVVKQGPEPVIVISPDGPQHVPANQLDNVTDTTGAGDAFAAGFLLALIAGAPPEAAARSGHDRASQTILETNRSALLTGGPIGDG